MSRSAPVTSTVTTAPFRPEKSCRIAHRAIRGERAKTRNLKLHEQLPKQRIEVGTQGRPSA